MADAVVGRRHGRIPDSGGDTGPSTEDMQAKIGQQALEINFLGRRAQCGRKEMIDATHKLPITRQAELLAISYSNLCYLPRSTSDADL